MIQAMPCFYVELLPTGIFFQTKALEKRMDTFSQSCFDITHVSSRLPSLSQPSFCVGLLQKDSPIFSITNKKSILMKKGVKIGTCIIIILI